MTTSSPIMPVSGPVRLPATRSPASGACGCARRMCWHSRQCRSNGVIRILRAPKPDSDVRTGVILCHECAAPTQRARIA